MGCGNSVINDVKESLSKDSIISENILKITKSICRINSSSNINYGFLIKFYKQNKEFFCLMTNVVNVTKDMIEKNEVIKFFYDNDSNQKEITLKKNERYIKDFLEIGLDTIIIELLITDNIEKDYFLLPLIIYNDDFSDLKNNEIIIIQNINNKYTHSNGKIQEINKFGFSYTSNNEINTSGYPIFLEDSNKVIGIQKSIKNIDKNSSL